MALGEHVEDRDRALGGERLELRVGPGAHADRLHVAREDPRRVADRLAARELHLAGAQDQRMPAQLDDAGLVGEPRARARLLEQQRDDRALERARRARRGLQLVRAVEQREQLVARQFGAGEEVARQAREDSAVMRILTWNLFHGRAVPDRAAPARRRVRRARCASWEWDVALLQEVPPWWPPHARRGVRRAGVHGAHLAQPGAAARARARGAPAGHREVLGRRGATRSSCAAHGVTAHARLRLRLRPERRVVHAVRRDDGLWLANLHASAHDRARGAGRHRRAPPRRCAAGRATSRSIFGGDMNTRAPAGRRASRTRAGTCIDHVFARGLAVAAPVQTLERGGLSDHAPVLATLKPALTRQRVRGAGGPPSTSPEPAAAQAEAAHDEHRALGERAALGQHAHLHRGVVAVEERRARATAARAAGRARSRGRRGPRRAAGRREARQLAGVRAGDAAPARR